MHIDDAGAVVLRDGTPLDSLIDREQRNLSARVHTDEEIFELELERLFAKAWIPVAHVSEFARPGDFVTRAIGLDQVIVTLADDGRHQVLLNVCTHRGATVCRAESGNASLHRCPFHGWGFGSDGALVGVPFDRQIYAGTLDKPNLGLRRARVATAVGLVFATWDDDAPPLEEYLGDFQWYLEAMLCRTDNGLEVAGPPQRFVVDCNWKVLTEGFFGDAYHVLTVHQSFADIGVLSHTDTTLRQFEISHNGHALLCFDFERLGLAGDPADVLRRVVPTGMPSELVEQVLRNLDDEQLALLTKTPPSIAGIFPTAAAIFIGAGPASPLGQVVSLRFFVPLSPHRTEILSFTMVERDATPEFKESVHRTSVQAFGVGGMFEADDVEVWESVQRGIRGAIGRRTLDNYQVMGEPAEHHGTLDHAGRGISSDEKQWLFYERYFQFLEGRAW